MADPTAVNDQITDAVAPSTSALPIGRFVWHDLVTPDVAAAKKYYSDLLGWTYKEFDMGEESYSMIHAAGTEWGGFMDLHPERGLPPHWVSYVTVPDVDAALATAEQGGGKVLVPGMDIPTVGRFAVIESPKGGAYISPYKPETSQGETAPVRADGTFVWHELLAQDAAVEGKFLAEIFGWRIEEMPMGEIGSYFLFKRLDTGTDAGGMMPKPPGDAGPSSWLPYVQVASADATAARTEELGGKVWVKPADIPGIGRFTVTSDPAGALIAFLQPPS